MSSDLLVELLQALDAPQARYCELENYYAGTQALAYLSADARSALDNRFGRMVSNLLGWQSIRWLSGSVSRGLPAPMCGRIGCGWI
ncbi:hypothetical protein ACRYGX_09125 [Mycobacteroides abscessus]